MRRISLMLASLAVLGCLALPLRSHAMRAGNLGESVNLSKGETPVSLQLSGGRLHGKSDELVFDSATGRKMSELNWELYNIYMLGAAVSVGATDWLLLNLGAWGAVNDDSRRMTDSDWLDASREDWSDRSIHRTKLDHGYMLDVNAEFPLPLNDVFTVAPMVGFKFDNWRWIDENFQYVNSGNGWRDDKGIMEGPAITYQQWFFTPYAGLSLGARYAGFSLDAYARGSLWGFAKDKDQHHLRDITFTMDVDEVHYHGLGAALSYAFTERFSAGLAYDYQEYSMTKGDPTIEDREAGTVEKDKDGGGLGHRSSMVSLTLRYAF